MYSCSDGVHGRCVKATRPARPTRAPRAPRAHHSCSLSLSQVATRVGHGQLGVNCRSRPPSRAATSARSLDGAQHETAVCSTMADSTRQQWLLTVSRDNPQC
jgi:hypothetical protein